MKDKVLIFGYGEVGEAIAECVKEAGYDVYIDDPNKGYIIKGSGESPIAIHICFPYSKHFIFQVHAILDVFDPDLTIIESTVPPDVFDTLLESDYPIVHSPVRGSHPHLYEDLHRMVKFISNEHPELCEEYYSKWKIDWMITGNAKEISAGKILSVNWYGMEISFAQMIKRYCEENGFDFEFVYCFFQSTMDVGRYYTWNRVEKKATSYSMGSVNRPTMFPGKIGGHCVMQDIAIAKEHNIGNKKLWDWIEEENDATI